jgi:hypothetical protein
MRRAARRQNPSVGNVLEEAEANLLSAFKKSSRTTHKGLKGDARARNVADFLEKRLPSGYGVLCKAEIVDYLDNRSQETDIVIIDKIRNAVLSDAPLWLPAESLLAYIEVKSILTRDELWNSYAAAKKLSTLRPFKRSFSLATNTPLASAEKPVPSPGNASAPLRCFRTVFAYDTNLSKTDWLRNEWARVVGVTNELQCTPALIDRILVLDRGMINPPSSTGTDEFEVSSVFQQWFTNLVNFLARENGRRQPVDLETYSKTQLPGWKSLV